jgi:[protein-PII] uridylyltransferase
LNLNLTIEELISRNSSDFEVSKVIKDEIKTYIDSLNSIFERDQGKSFLVKHTKQIDMYIKTIFKYALRKQFGEYLPLINTLPITLVSLGSYAREQLCVYSDIDLMIVYKKVDGYNLEPIIESILQIAWDSGLKLGHRVHQLEDLYQASLEDQTIKTALIESRYICGSKYLWMHTQNELQKIRHDNQKAYILEKIKEREDRLKKYTFNMEPDIKSSAGGLRDLNSLFWIANVLHNITKIKELIPNIVLEKEYARLMQSIEFIYRVRVALHLSANKKQDQLLLHFIPDVAKKLKLTQRRLVEKTFEAMLRIETVCEYLIKKVTHSILYEKKNFKIIRESRKSKDIYISNKRVCSPLHTPTKTLPYFVENFLESEDLHYYFETTYIYALQKARKQEVDNEMIKSIFYRTYVYSFLIALYKSKQINMLFPAMKKVTHLPQFDGYHKYPVDIHSIRTLLILEDIDDIHVKNLFEKFKKEEKALLRVVAFLHDCGKGRKKDHSELGAVIVKNFVKELEFSPLHVKYAHTLVKYHTLMSNIANREDIYSEKIIFGFISKLKDIKLLELLYVLTYADIESVGKGTYSSFNARLLNELYLIARDAFANKKRITEAEKRNKKERQLIKSFFFKAQSRVLQKKILSIESNLLFLKHSPEAIIQISSWVYSLKNLYDYKITDSDTLVIEIIRKKDLNLGFLLGKLSNLSVVSMDIFKIFDEVKYFRVEFAEHVEKDDILFIEEIINNSFDMDKKVTLKNSQIIKKEIDIKCNHSKTYARLSISTKDSPQLLANIMSTFDDIGIDIASAKIQTIKNKARNLFLIEKNGKFCNNQAEVIKKLTIK